MKHTILTTFVALLVSANAWAQPEDRFHRALDVGPDAELSLGNISGDIRIEGVAGSTITIDAVKSVEDPDDAELLQNVEVEVSQLGNRVRVSTEYTGGRGRRHRDHDGSVSVSYRVTVPKGTAVEIQSVSGSVSVTAVEGTANVQSVSGDVRVEGVVELEQAKSVSGNVEVLRARSSRHAAIESVSGEVVVRDIQASELTVSSVSGDVLLDGVSSKRASLESVSGNLEYTGSIAPSGRYEFSAHSGDVILTIGDDVGFELEASTFSGEIESDFTLQTTARAQKGQRISAVVGDGSAFIEASTFSGDVRLVRR